MSDHMKKSYAMEIIGVVVGIIIFGGMYLAELSRKEHLPKLVDRVRPAYIDYLVSNELLPITLESRIKRESVGVKKSSSCVVTVESENDKYQQTIDAYSLYYCDDLVSAFESFNLLLEGENVISSGFPEIRDFRLEDASKLLNSVLHGYIQERSKIVSNQDEIKASWEEKSKKDKLPCVLGEVNCN